MKPAERTAARQLCADGGSIKRIAAELSVSPSSVSRWTADIALAEDQMERLLLRYPARTPSGTGASGPPAAIVQSIYGAIQEYAGIERPEWLDCRIPSRSPP